MVKLNGPLSWGDPTQWTFNCAVAILIAILWNITHTRRWLGSNDSELTDFLFPQSSSNFYSREASPSSSNPFILFMDKPHYLIICRAPTWKWNTIKIIMRPQWRNERKKVKQIKPSGTWDLRWADDTNSLHSLHSTSLQLGLIKSLISGFSALVPNDYFYLFQFIINWKSGTEAQVNERRVSLVGMNLVFV